MPYPDISTPATRPRRRRWMLSLAIALAVLSTLTAAAPTPEPAGTSAAGFTDARAPHTPAIEALAAADITNGCDPSRYCPDDAVTRAQLAALLARALELPTSNGPTFPDLPSDHVLAPDVRAAAEAGIVEGLSDGRLAPAAAVSRGQAASMMSRALVLEPAAGPSFRDTIDTTHEDAVETLVAAGITDGCREQLFCPGHSLTRGQAASLIARGLGLVAPIPEGERPMQLPPDQRTRDTGTPGGDLAPAGSREALLGQRAGFGRNAGSDSANWTDVVVTTLADSGSGSLREALTSGQRWIRFQEGLSGTISVGSKMAVPSDVVIDGRGADITLRGGSSNEILGLTRVDNVIIANLKFEGGHDAIQIFEGTTNVWIHRITASAAADEIIAITGDGSRPDLITVSWSRFNNGGKVMLLSGSEYDVNHAADRVTIHHNVFYRSRDRQPLVRFARVHYYNNWVYQWGESGTGQAIRVGNDGQFASENNVFDDAYGRPAMIPEDLGTYGYIRSDGDVTTGDPEIEEREPGQVFDPSSHYGYDLDPAGESLRQALRDGAGWQS